MPLPIPTMPLTTSSLYPDLIKVSCRYRLTTPIARWQFTTLLRENGFRPINGGRQLRGPVEFSPLGKPLSIVVSPPGRDVHVTVTVDLDPLRFFHAVGRGPRFGTAVPDAAVQRDFGDERSTDGKVNWLHPDDVGLDNGWLLDWCDEAMTGIFNQVYLFLDGLLSRLDGEPGLSLVGMGVRSIQVTADLSAADPGAVVRNHERPFRQMFCNVETNDYGETAASYETRAGGTRMLHGFRAAGERYKIYNKTNRRFRLECVLDRRALRRLGIRGTLIDGPRGRAVTSFGDWFERCAGVVLPHLNALLAELHGTLTDQRAPMELQYDVAHYVRRRAVGLEILRCLVRDGGVPSRIDHRAVARLREAGVLRLTARGINAVGESYVAALEVLRQDEDSWLAMFDQGANIRVLRTPEGAHLYRHRERPTQRR